MTFTSVGLLALGVLLAEPISRLLAGARWPARDPVGALLLWQAIGLAGGLALLGAGLAYGLAPLADSLPCAALAVFADPGRLPGLGGWQLAALAVTALLGARLLGVLALAVWRTLRARRRHRDLLDLLGTPWPRMSGARVLAHPLPVAYCLPGLRSRLVLSSGALDALTPDELAAVLAHERAHLRERHDLVVLPFVAWGSTAPFVAGMVRAQVAVARLAEMRADDVACAEVGSRPLAAALRRIGGATDSAVLTSFSAAAAERVRRMTPDHPEDLPVAARTAVRIAALALVSVPTALLVVANFH